MPPDYAAPLYRQRESRMPLLKPVFFCALAATLAAPGVAMKRDGSSIVAEYVRARAADADGQVKTAAAGYAVVLAASPDDEVIALRAYRQAMVAGDRALALKAAQSLVAKDALPADGRLLLLVNAVDRKDWKQATAITDRIAKDGAFVFAVPVIRAWLARAQGRDPFPLLGESRRSGVIASTYVAEHRALLLVASGQYDDGVAAIRSLTMTSGTRASRLRLAVAAEIAKADKARAIGLLAGDEPIYADARATIRAGKPLPGAIDSAAEGIAELFIRVAIDISSERVTPLAVTLARFGTFLAPQNAEGWLVTSDLLASAAQYDAALQALDQVRRDDPFHDAAATQRVQLLVKQGGQATALKEALASANRPDASAGDWASVGGIYTSMKQPADAVKAYAKAVALSQREGDGESRWTLLLLQANALDQSGDWPGAKAVLQQAAKLAPDQPAVLNYLGYAQLERGENLDQASKLIEQASKLRPDDAAITDSLGWTYYLRGNIPLAIETLERAVAGEPGESTINEHLGDAYWKAGRRVEARWAWRAALVYADDAEARRIRTKMDDGLAMGKAAP